MWKCVVICKHLVHHMSIIFHLYSDWFLHFYGPKCFLITLVWCWLVEWCLQMYCLSDFFINKLHHLWCLVPCLTKIYYCTCSQYAMISLIFVVSWWGYNCLLWRISHIHSQQEWLDSMWGNPTRGRLPGGSNEIFLSTINDLHSTIKLLFPSSILLLRKDISYSNKAYTSNGGVYYYYLLWQMILT